METQRAEFSISELAREFDVTPRAIRFYEDQGLLAPRRDGQRRIYTLRDRTRLKLTLRGKRLGLTLAEIRELIDMYEPGRDERPQLERFREVLEAALIVAEAEAEEGAWSTFFLMTRSSFYNLASKEGERAVARLRELGHRIGHHAVYPHVDLDSRFDAVVAWHNPEPAFMQIEIPGAVNVMRPPFFDPPRYRSDSNQSWRNGCPHDALERGEFEWLHLLIHAEIWAFEGETMRETMESFLDADRAARLERLSHDRIDLS